MITRSNDYFKCLLKHLSKIDSFDAYSKNQYWLDECNKILSNASNLCLDNLPSIMSLIYPDFYFDSNGNYLGDHINHKSSTFNFGISFSDECQFQSIYFNGRCEFNAYKSIRGKCQADHLWPNSLGGPSILENRILLCKFHNIAKSNSIISDFWRLYPTWINEYLNRLYTLKQ